MSQTRKFEKVTNCEVRTYKHFANFIDKAKSEGYKIGGFGKLKELKNANKAVIMRHDIDFSPKSAVTLAGLEDVLGITATYFISIHRPHYTPLTREMRKTIHVLLEHGHEIGLHYEPEFDDLQAEIGMLETYLDCKIVAIARHNPFGNHLDIDSNSKPKEVIDAYSGEIMREFKYISDSSGIWREGCFCGWIGKENKLQVLIHPEWWEGMTLDPVSLLRTINDKWIKEQSRVAEQSVKNLEVHREKISNGQA